MATAHHAPRAAAAARARGGRGTARAGVRTIVQPLRRAVVRTRLDGLPRRSISSTLSSRARGAAIAARADADGDAPDDDECRIPDAATVIAAADDAKARLDEALAAMSTAVQSEDYGEAARARDAADAIAATDPIEAAQRLLDRALEDEDYALAAQLRDDSALALVGEWMGKAPGDEEPYGRLLRIEKGPMGRLVGSLHPGEAAIPGSNTRFKPEGYPVLELFYPLVDGDSEAGGRSVTCASGASPVSRYIHRGRRGEELRMECEVGLGGGAVAGLGMPGAAGALPQRIKFSRAPTEDEEEGARMQLAEIQARQRFEACLKAAADLARIAIAECKADAKSTGASRADVEEMVTDVARRVRRELREQVVAGGDDALFGEEELAAEDDPIAAYVSENPALLSDDEAIDRVVKARTVEEESQRLRKDLLLEWERENGDGSVTTGTEEIVSPEGGDASVTGGDGSVTAEGGAAAGEEGEEGEEGGGEDDDAEISETTEGNWDEFWAQTKMGPEEGGSEVQSSRYPRIPGGEGAGEGKGEGREGESAEDEAIRRGLEAQDEEVRRGLEAALPKEPTDVDSALYASTLKDLVGVDPEGIDMTLEMQVQREADERLIDIVVMSAIKGLQGPAPSKGFTGAYLCGGCRQILSFSHEPRLAPRDIVGFNPGYAHDEACDFEPLAHGVKLMSPEDSNERMARAFDELQGISLGNAVASSSPGEGAGGEGAGGGGEGEGGGGGEAAAVEGEGAAGAEAEEAGGAEEEAEGEEGEEEGSAKASGDFEVSDEDVKNLEESIPPELPAEEEYYEGDFEEEGTLNLNFLGYDTGGEESVLEGGEGGAGDMVYAELGEAEGLGGQDYIDLLLLPDAPGATQMNDGEDLQVVGLAKGATLDALKDAFPLHGHTAVCCKGCGAVLGLEFALLDGPATAAPGEDATAAPGEDATAAPGEGAGDAAAEVAAEGAAAAAAEVAAEGADATAEEGAAAAAAAEGAGAAVEVLDEADGPKHEGKFTALCPQMVMREGIGILGRGRLPRDVVFTKAPPPSVEGRGDLGGLYVGGYGTAGPEIVLVEVDEGRQLRAKKVTGDQNVPSGTVSFTADLSKPGAVSARDFPSDWNVTGSYDGQGTLASANFTDPHEVPGLFLTFRPTEGGAGGKGGPTAGAAFGFAWEIAGNRALVLFSRLPRASQS